jgi:hypothetical protein
MFRLWISLAAFVLSLTLGVASSLLTSLLTSSKQRGDSQSKLAAAESLASESTRVRRTADANSLRQTVASLHEIKEYDSDVPPAARPLLTRFKHQIRDLIAHTLSAYGVQINPADVRRIVWDQLSAEGVIVEQPREGAPSEDWLEGDHSYGDVYDVQAEMPTGHPELLAVITTLEIPCGRDSSLYIFRHDQSEWKLILAREANEYDQVNGAQGLFSYKISQGSGDNFYVLTANVNPWCTSNWQDIRYAALRPGPGPYEPQVMAAGEETIYLGVDPPLYELVVQPKWFSISFVGESSSAELREGINSRRHVVKYLIKQGRATRVSMDVSY